MEYKTKTFLKPKPVDALISIVSIPEPYTQQVSRDINTTYAHAVNVIKRLEEEGLIETRREGRKKVLKPTDKGVKLSQDLINVKQTLGESMA